MTTLEHLQSTRHYHGTPSCPNNRFLHTWHHYQHHPIDASRRAIASWHLSIGFASVSRTPCIEHSHTTLCIAWLLPHVSPYLLAFVATFHFIRPPPVYPLTPAWVSVCTALVLVLYNCVLLISSSPRCVWEARLTYRLFLFLPVPSSLSSRILFFIPHFIFTLPSTIFHLPSTHSISFVALLIAASSVSGSVPSVASSPQYLYSSSHVSRVIHIIYSTTSDVISSGVLFTNGKVSSLVMLSLFIYS